MVQRERIEQATAIYRQLIADWAANPCMIRKHFSPPNHWNWRIPVTHRHGTRHGTLMFVGGQCDLDADGNVLQSR